MGFFTIVDRTMALLSAAITGLLSLARPLLRIQFGLYKQDVRTALFPEDDPEFVIAGPNPDRLLFIGDVAVAGYGVLSHGMTTASQTARFLSRDRGRGCSWSVIAATDLTAARVASMPSLDATGVGVAVLMLGIPDVLLGTSSPTWAASLGTIVDRIRDQAGRNCRVVFAGIPPMADFRPVPSLARRIMTLQIQRFNRVTLATASQLSNTSFVRFPDWRVGEMYVEELFSWKAMHEMWARVLASAASQLMADDDNPAPDSNPA